VNADSYVKVFSSWYASSPICNSPLFKRTWTVRQKCLPWCTRGSIPQLFMNSEPRSSDCEGKTYGLFIGPSCQAPGCFWPTEASQELFLSEDMRRLERLAG
jgi:hypothetical protein